MGREYCIHMVRIEDDCDDCVTYGGPGVWETARAWQAFRDFLNGTPEQWAEREADAYAEGENDGFDRGVAAVHELREGMSPPDDKAAIIRKVLDDNRDILEALGDD